MRDELLSIWPRDGIQTIVDLGCRDCWHTAGLPGVTRHIGVEVWLPALERGLRKALAGGIPHFEAVYSDVLDYLGKYGDEHFDAVLAIDLLEHLDKDRALKLLGEMERTARLFCVTWTTMGYVRQGPYDVDGQPNPFEEHKWGPVMETFTRRGWMARAYPRWHEERGGAILAWLSK
jgi:hypothetical protein